MFSARERCGNQCGSSPNILTATLVLKRKINHALAETWCRPSPLQMGAPRRILPYKWPTGQNSPMLMVCLSGQSSHMLMVLVVSCKHYFRVQAPYYDTHIFTSGELINILGAHVFEVLPSPGISVYIALSISNLKNCSTKSPCKSLLMLWACVDPQASWGGGEHKTESIYSSHGLVQRR